MFSLYRVQFDEDIGGVCLSRQSSPSGDSKCDRCLRNYPFSKLYAAALHNWAAGWSPGVSSDLRLANQWVLIS